MTTLRNPLQARHRALWIGGVGLVLLPVALQAAGLTLDNATVVVLLCMAGMGLNLLVGVVRGITIHFVPAAGEASMYVLMLLVLLFRPRGLLGERIERFE